MRRYKYPRTYHLPFSPGATSDDKYIESFDAFEGQEIVVTEKMDGENTTIYPDAYVHARSIDSGNHESRSVVKQLAAQVSPMMKYEFTDSDWRITGENLYAKHSIQYTNLKSYFYMFGMWRGDVCCSWDKTVEVAEKYGLSVVPELYRGTFDTLVIKSLEQQLRKNQEGFVVRLVRDIGLYEWPGCIAKWVRPNHVQTDEHWMNKSVVKNILMHSFEQEK